MRQRKFKLQNLQAVKRGEKNMQLHVAKTKGLSKSLIMRKSFEYWPGQLKDPSNMCNA